MDKQKLHELRVFAAEIRLETLKVIASRGFGHVGGSMSMADAMAVLYGEVMHIDPKNPRWEDRDWFVLSKGHGARSCMRRSVSRDITRWRARTRSTSRTRISRRIRPQQDHWR